MVKGVRISWAIPLAITPREASFCDSWICNSNLRCSVKSRPTITKPTVLPASFVISETTQDTERYFPSLVFRLPSVMQDLSRTAAREKNLRISASSQYLRNGQPFTSSKEYPEVF